MHVFVTGAAGFVGRAVVKELRQHGHTVLGLARSDESAEVIRGLGAEPHRGDLEDTESLRSGAKAADAVIHLAFIHDFTKFEKSTVIDRTVIEAMSEELAGKPLVIASGTMMYPGGKLATEDSGLEEGSLFAERGKSSTLLNRLSKEIGVHGASVRLAVTVHDKEDHGFIPLLGGLSKKAGIAYYVGDGSNRWPAVHRADAAVLFRLAIEKSLPGGVVYNAVAEIVPTKEIMATVGKKLQVPVEGKSVEEVTEAYGFFGHALAKDNIVSSEKTQEMLGWTPTHPKLLVDIEENYFV